MSLESSDFTWLKKLLIVSLFAYALILLISLIRRFLTKKSPEKNSPRAKRAFLFLTGFFYLLLFSGFSLITISTVRLQNWKESVNFAALRRLENYPAGKFYYGFKNVYDELQTIVIALRQKCSQAEDLSFKIKSIEKSNDFIFSSEFSDVFAQQNADENESEIFLTWNELKTFSSQKAQSCWEEIKESVARCEAAKEFNSFVATRFNGVIGKVGQKIKLGVIATLVSLPLLLILLASDFWRLFKNGREAAEKHRKEKREEEENRILDPLEKRSLDSLEEQIVGLQASGKMSEKSVIAKKLKWQFTFDQIGLIASLILFGVLFGILMVAFCARSSSKKTLDIYTGQKSLSSFSSSFLPLTNSSESSHENLQENLRAFDAFLQTELKTSSKIEKRWFETLQISSLRIERKNSSIVSISNFVNDLQTLISADEEIDKLVNVFWENLKASDLRPLMRRHIIVSDAILGNGLLLGILIAFGAAFGVYAVKSIQILFAV